MAGNAIFIRDEGQLCDVILWYADMLTCYNCGETLTKNCIHGSDKEIGILRIDNGSTNYPREPDEPAQAYFECITCREERMKKEGANSVSPEWDQEDQDLDRIKAEETLKRVRNILDSAKSPISVCSDREKAFHTINAVLTGMGY